MSDRANTDPPTAADISNTIDGYDTPLPLAALGVPYALDAVTDMDAHGSDLTDGGTTLYDATAGEFVQATLAGPASSLSSYPLPPGDLDLSVASPVTLDAGTIALGYAAPLELSNGKLGVSLGNGLAVDGANNLYIPAGAIGSAEIAADAVGTNEIGAGGVETANIADDAVDAAQLAPDSVRAAAILDDTIGQAKLANDAVGTAQIENYAVNAARIATDAVGNRALAFDPATQAELDGHAGDTTNPHNVDDSQTGAASALSSHAGDANAHHSPPSLTGYHDHISFTELASRSTARHNLPNNLMPTKVSADCSSGVGDFELLLRTGFDSGQTFEIGGYNVSLPMEAAVFPESNGASPNWWEIEYYDQGSAESGTVNADFQGVQL